LEIVRLGKMKRWIYIALSWKI